MPLRWRIAVYTVLRRSDLFEKEKTEWNIAHAESGLVLMTAEGFAVAAMYAFVQAVPTIGWRPLALIGVILWVCS